jgi:steroid 5-alpha reductase family enzyme
MEGLLYYFIFSLGFNLLLFLVAYLLQTDKITDISYSLTFVAIALYSFFQSDQSIIDILLNFTVVLWAVRLGSYLLYRIKVMGHDKRFDEIRTNFVSFLTFWVMQGLTCFIVMIPIIKANMAEGKSLNSFIIVGLILAAFGLTIETIADVQKFRFKRSNPDQFMKSGLWSSLQHPNYSGELLFWWALFIASIPFTTWYFVIIGPLWITFIITKFSGIPILQKKWQENYGSDPSFQDYQKRSYKLIPYVY